jgi:antitoxin HicB
VVLRTGQGDILGAILVAAAGRGAIADPGATFQDETGGCVATCPSLPGCYSPGDTVDGALDNIREAIELCLEDMQAHGEVIPDPSRVLVGSVVVTR